MRSRIPHLTASVLVVQALLACGHVDRAPESRRAERQLLVLERDFLAFTAHRLDRGLDDERLAAAQAVAGVDSAVADLERLRLRYLDVLSTTSTDQERLTALVRIAELHLDLGARIRRLPYPQPATPQELQAFDERLSARALPLEAVGFGVLSQVVATADHEHLEGRFIRRARLYLALHADERELGRDDVATLRAELAARGFYPAPRTLLEAGRVGQRAARR